MPGCRAFTSSSNRRAAKSWAVRYRHAGRTRKHTIGPYPAVNLATARKLGANALRAVAEGRDPGREKMQAAKTDRDSIEHLVAQFIERHAKPNTRPTTLRTTQRILEKEVLPAWGGRTIGSITRRDVLDLLDGIVDRGAPVSANRTLAVIRKFFSWAAARDVIESSPCAGVRPPAPVRSRDRVLSDDELQFVWRAALNIGWPFGPLVRLLLLTAQRRDEVAGMRWVEIDLGARLWTLPRARVKNNEPHEVPLSEAAMAVIEALPRIAGPFVFTTTGRSSATGYSRAKKRLDALLPRDMPPWTFHDLRRTAASGMARLGINLPVIEKVLNHTSGSFAGVVKVYQRYQFETEKRRALEVWGRFVAALVAEQPAENVVGLGRRR